jgi:hypothetical protein
LATRSRIVVAAFHADLLCGPEGIGLKEKRAGAPLGAPRKRKRGHVHKSKSARGTKNRRIRKEKRIYTNRYADEIRINTRLRKRAKQALKRCACQNWNNLHNWLCCAETARQRAARPAAEVAIRLGGSTTRFPANPHPRDATLESKKINLILGCLKKESRHCTRKV